MACKIIFGRNPDGTVNDNIIQEVKAPNEQRSFLFDEIKKLSPNDRGAYTLYATTFTPDFKDLINPKTKFDSNNEVTIDQFVKYYNTLYDIKQEEISNSFRNKQNGNRVRVLNEKDALKLAKKYNDKSTDYIARVQKMLGEKSDNRVYNTVDRKSVV
jgi:hypothetical protein